MISVSRAEQLHSAGLRWRPAPGDRFAVRTLADQVFTISDMVVEPHEYPTGTVLGFNGTTEWALDSVAQEDALWLPREDQLRELLGRTFRSLARSTDGQYQVLVELSGQPERVFTADDAADAYAQALLALVSAAVGPGLTRSVVVAVGLLDRDERAARRPTRPTPGSSSAAVRRGGMLIGWVSSGRTSWSGGHATPGRPRVDGDRCRTADGDGRRPARAPGAPASA